MNYGVGVTRDKKWQILTDGNDVYEQIDFYYPDLKYALQSDENPVRKLDLTQHQLVAFCNANSLKLHRPVARSWFNEFTLEAISKKFNELKYIYSEWHRIKEHERNVEDHMNKVMVDLERLRWDKYYGTLHISKMDDMSGQELEFAIREIYEKRGYTATLTKATGDYGVDIVARHKGKVLAIQAKRYSKPVGVKAVQEVASGCRFYGASDPIVITNSTFTDNAKNLARSLSVKLIDRKDLQKMWAETFPMPTIPAFDKSQYDLNETSISALIGKPLFKHKVRYLSNLLMAKNSGVGIREWVLKMRDLDSTGSRFLFKTAIELGYITQEEVDSATR